MSKWRIGDKIENRYEVIQILGGPGKSGMGIIYVCYDHQGKVPLAIKTLQDKYFNNKAFIKRFLYEAETWVRLGNHYNIVRAFSVHEVKGLPYVLIEYIVGDKRYGTDLSGWIHGGGLHSNGKPDIALILRYSIQFCHGMIHANKKFSEIDKPFVHRDIKPQNILITSNSTVKITDFGLVKTFQALEEDILPVAVQNNNRSILKLSKSGAIIGTPPYMSPEQCRGMSDIDSRTDIYAFGCVLYEMLSNRYVFDTNTFDGFIYHHIYTKPQSPNRHREFDQVVLKCLEKSASARYSNFTELEKDLSTIYENIANDRILPPSETELEDWGLYNKGIALNTLGFPEEAIACYKEALRINPNIERYHFVLGLAYMAKAMQIPKLFYTLQDLSDAYFKFQFNKKAAQWVYPDAVYPGQSQLNWAISEFKEAIRINPNVAILHQSLGCAYIFQNETNLAISELEEALRIDPNNAEIQNLLDSNFAVFKSKETKKLINDDDEVRAKEDKLALAISEFKETLRINPKDTKTRILLGNAYLEQREDDLAISEYKQALKINNKDAMAHLHLGSVYASSISKRDWDLAYSEFKEGLKIDSRLPISKEICSNIAEAFRNKGDDYRAQQKLDKAKTEYEEALKFDPECYWAHDSLACIYMEQGKYDLAISEFREVVKVKPDFFLAYIHIGEIYAYMDKLELAIDEFKKALRFKYDNEEVHVHLGNAYATQNKLDAAILEFNEALRIKPNFSSPHIGLGVVYYKQNKLGEAIREYKEALIIDPNIVEAYLRIGVVYEDLDKLDIAISEYEEALRIDPNSKEAHLTLGAAYGNLGKPDMAILEFKEALRLHPDYMKAHFNLGFAYKERGEKDMAVLEYREALRIDPNSKETHLALGALYGNLGKPDMEILEYKEALRIDANFAEVHFNLGFAYQELGKLDMAISEYEEVLRINPDYMEAHFNLGAAYEDVGKLDMAISEYQEALRLNPDDIKIRGCLDDVFRKQDQG